MSELQQDSRRNSEDDLKEWEAEERAAKRKAAAKNKKVKDVRYLVIVEFDCADIPLQYFVGVVGGKGVDVEAEAIALAIEQDFEEQGGDEEEYERLSEDSVSNVTVINEGTIKMCFKDAEKRRKES